MLNEVFGWFWIGFGFAVGGVMGIAFHRPDWLGGYASWPRRLLRLGHIAMIALGVLNILFAHSAARLALPHPWVSLASSAMLAGATLMPACCFLSAWKPATRVLFPIPALLLGFGVTITWIGLLCHWLAHASGGSP